MATRTTRTTRTTPARPRPAARGIDLPKERALDLLRQMWEIRLFEERVYDLLGKNQIKGASHLYAGQEAVAVGAVAALRDDDLVTSTHRGHVHAHAHGDKAASTPAAKKNERKPLDGFVAMEGGRVVAHAAITRAGARPLEHDEVRRVFAVNLCLVCHDEAKDPIYRKGLDYDALDDALHRRLLAGRR